MSNVTSSPIWSVDIAGAANEVSWLWDGFLAAGNLTLLTSLWKSGKTTLVALLLNRRVQGGQLLGRARACALGIVLRTGAGSKWDPFRYGLANAGGEEDVAERMRTRAT